MYCPDNDRLTGLLTRDSFIERARSVISSNTDSRVERERLALIWFNLNNFKMFNKRFGFERGDDILREIALILSSTFSSSSSSTANFRRNLIARFSDDNFVVLTEEWSEIDVNIDIVQEYLYSLHENVTLRLRAGIYFPSEDEDIRSSCDRAKLACDSIRKNHSVSFCMFHKEMSMELSLQQYILDTLDKAMSCEYITVLYQPIVRLSTGKICEAEALARWNDPETGLISPAKFIPTLEQYREIHKLDIHAMKIVCRDYRERFGHGLSLVPVSVNLSRLDFELCDIIGEIESAVSSNNIPRDMMRIEITESINEEDTRVLNLGIEKLRTLGYQVWMDDFGSGYSSLNVLKDYNFDTIKFDMKFLHGFDIAKSGKAKYIISSNLGMARLMGMQALAEGVETGEQLEYLKSIGFDKGQGYFFGKPMKLEEIFLLDRGCE